ncbi:HIS7 [Candida oxycetoniae]|uniref:HIS7 n=1 Tax=Candida oxycetoniae TaxID=497107 RepID=A0AAI9T0F0_9ASCO|nr:HIS7 [Candida oxycetoniae]KAI3406561.2 HIS7 [Candida oxycetoniae]
MSFFVVPSVSYQTQQKLKKQKGKDRKKNELDSDSDKDVDPDRDNKDHRYSIASRLHNNDSTTSSTSKRSKLKAGWSLFSGGGNHSNSSNSSSSLSQRGFSTGSKSADTDSDSKSIMSSHSTMISGMETLTHSLVDENESPYPHPHPHPHPNPNLHLHPHPQPPQAPPVSLNLPTSLESPTNAHTHHPHTHHNNNDQTSNTHQEQVHESHKPHHAITPTAAQLVFNPEDVVREEDTPLKIATTYGKTIPPDSFKQFQVNRAATIPLVAATTSATATSPGPPASVSSVPSTGSSMSSNPFRSSQSSITPITPLTTSQTANSSSGITTSPTQSHGQPQSQSQAQGQAQAQSPGSHYLSNQLFHRNSSNTSFHGNQNLLTMDNLKESSAKFKKISSFLTSSNHQKRKDSTFLSPGGPDHISPNVESPGGDRHPSFDSYFPDISPMKKKNNDNNNSNKIPAFKPVLDLSAYNTPEGIQEQFLSPPYQIFRYNNFLKIMSEYHTSDALNFAKIRVHSLYKFIMRQKRGKILIESNGMFSNENYTSLSTTEAVLAYMLYSKARSFIRTLVCHKSENQSLLNHEELVQCNFINYVRYLIKLPTVEESDVLTDVEKKHYEYKAMFDTIATALYNFRKDEELTYNDEPEQAVKSKLLIESITKLSYEYILLEKYRLDMVTKLHKNHLLSQGHLVKLFNQYKAHVRGYSRENIKVFIYNSTQSLQYGWYLAVTIPFIRFVESHVYNEDPQLITDYDEYIKQLLDTNSPKQDFKKSDIELFESYFKKLGLVSYQQFNSMTMDKLVKLSKQIKDQSVHPFTGFRNKPTSSPSFSSSQTQYSTSSFSSPPPPPPPSPFPQTSNFSTKPTNIEYYPHGMSSISSNTFDLIHSRDLAMQITQNTYRTIIREFHRILKPGASFIYDAIHMGSRSPETLKSKFSGKLFPEIPYDENNPSINDKITFGIMQNFPQLMPHFLETLLCELEVVFGKGNVKYSVVLLSSHLDVNNFLIKFVGLKLFELVGETDEYVRFFESVFDDDDSNIMSKVVHIIDLESGNLRSLTNAIKKVDSDCTIRFIHNEQEFIEQDPYITKLIFPGVGNYGHFVTQIYARNLDKHIMRYIAADRALMGICVGLQAFVSASEESPNAKGLGVLDLKLKKFNTDDPIYRAKGIKKAVPHIGWNSIERITIGKDKEISPNVSLFNLNLQNKYYFVHSYAAIIDGENENELNSLRKQGWNFALAKYGSEQFIAAINKGNLFATQFHPEKSGIAGLKIVKSFLDGEQFPQLNQSSVQTQPKGIEKTMSRLTRRIIACLDVRTNDAGDLVVTKGDQYNVRETCTTANSQEDNSTGPQVRNLGKPVELATKYYLQGADEITFLNITSFRNSPLKDLPMLQVLQKAAESIFVPLTVGGGIKEMQDPETHQVVPAVQVADLYFRSGADKVSIGSDAVRIAEEYYANNKQKQGTSAIETISKTFGNQAVVISVDPKRKYVASPKSCPMATIKITNESKYGPNGEQYCYYQVTSQGGRKFHDLGALELCLACEDLGAGEILLNSIDHDGSNSGFNLELLNQIKSQVSIPVIASSGAGNPKHFQQVFEMECGIDAALGAGLFHRGEYTVNQVKRFLQDEAKMDVRLDDTVEARALERLQRKRDPVVSSTQQDRVLSKRPASQILDPSAGLKSKFVQFEQDGSVKRSKTAEQIEHVEQNRLKAIEIQNRLRKEKEGKPDTNAVVSMDNIRLNQNKQDFSFDSKRSRYQPPSINKKDYIEYDFATMQDSRGGFISDDTKIRHDEETLQEWKEKQKELERIKNAPPPADIENVPRCYECKSVDIDLNLYTNFRKVRACRACIKKMPEKYSLLVKTECKEDYLLTEPELQDESLLPRIEKPNPHGYSRMQLFLRFQVEEFAWRKWGSPEGLDLEWERREKNKLKRKEKRYQDALREMRKKTRAEEYTRKLRDGKSLNERHVHHWSAGVTIGENLIRKRCIDCGIESEDVIITDTSERSERD